MTQTRKYLLTLLCLTAALALTPLFVTNRYILDLLILFCVWSAVASQWNLLMGQAGIFSLAQMAIFSVGGYVTAILGAHLGIAPAWSLLPAGIVCALFGLLIGLPCLRLKGAYVALLTLSAHYVVYLLILADTSGFTGGSYGLYGFGDYGFRALLGPRKEIIGDYYIAIVLFFIMVAVAYFLSRSPLGLAFNALRDSEAYAEARGIGRYKHQLLVFTITSFFIGIAGSFYGTHLKLVDTTSFDFGTIMTLLAIMVIGGQRHSWGPMLGCALVIVLNEALRGIPEWRAIVIAFVTMAVLLIWPLGIATFIDQLLGGLRRRRGTQPARTSA